MSKKLETPGTDHHDAFVSEYIKDFNATRAAERAGYTSTHPFGLNNIGSELVNDPRIREKIGAILAERAVTGQEALDRISRFARATMADFISFDSTNQPYLDLAKARDLGVLDVVQRFKVFGGKIVERKLDDGSVEPVRVGDTIEINLFDSMRAVEVLLRVHGRLGSLGTGSDPVVNVQMSMAEWRKQRESAQEQVNETLDEFEESSGDVADEVE